MIKDLPELKTIAKGLKTLKAKGVIRTKNLVGDLGEYYCKEFFNLKLEKVVKEGFDARDQDGNLVEIKTRRMPNPHSKVIFRSFKFDYCLFVELNEFFEPIQILKIEIAELKKFLDKKADRTTVSKIRNKMKTEKIY